MYLQMGDLEKALKDFDTSVSLRSAVDRSDPECAPQSIQSTSLYGQQPLMDRSRTTAAGVGLCGVLGGVGTC